jgi:uncharacterized protein (TIGR02391 family)
MTRRPSPMESIPPTLSAFQAVERIKAQLSKLGEIALLHHDDPTIEGWVSTTIAVLDAAFGKPNGDDERRTREFRNVEQHVYFSGMPDSRLQQYHAENCERWKVLLRSFIEQLEILAPPAATTAVDRYSFHPEIERVSGQLYRNGHYKAAALEAYIRVIDEVKRKSGLTQDGDNLMNHAFGCDGRTPLLKFNGLGTESEHDEQRGFMFLFKGIVGLRNSKAHSNRLFDDPSRGHEYLALASVLMRLLEIAEK